jgi:hypothetical protein
MKPPVRDRQHLIEIMDGEGYDWDAAEGVFVPRRDGPMAGGMVLSILAALQGYDPDRYLDRSDEVREPRRPPVQLPSWGR